MVSAGVLLCVVRRSLCRHARVRVEREVAAFALELLQHHDDRTVVLVDALTERRLERVRERRARGVHLHQVRPPTHDAAFGAERVVELLVHGSATLGRSAAVERREEAIAQRSEASSRSGPVAFALSGDVVARAAR